MAIPSDAVAHSRVAAARPGSAVVACRVRAGYAWRRCHLVSHCQCPESAVPGLLLTGSLQLNQDVPGRHHVSHKTAIP